MPAISLSEPFQKPTTMLYRNLLAMETEELLRSLSGRRLRADGRLRQDHAGADHGRAVDEPAGDLRAGRPDAARRLQGPGFLGSGSDTWKYWAELRAGNITEQDWQGVEDGIARSPGHCMTMGTASTMTSAAEAMGLTLPGAASIPAPDSRHAQMATLCGQAHRRDGLGGPVHRATSSMPARSDNAVTTVLALGGSTNAIVHLIAMARRAGVELDLDRFDELARANARARQHPALGQVPDGGLLLRGRPARPAGAARRPARRLGADRRAAARWARTLAGSAVYNDDVIRPRESPLVPRDGLAVLRGNLAPDGAVIKPAAMEAHLLAHTGRAVVFRDYNDMAARIDDPALGGRRRTRCSCCRAPARKARRACPSGAAADSEEAACSRACATWCASPTRA